MARLNRRQLFQAAEDDVRDHKRAYLRQFGWELTCNTPGSYWLWRRDFAAEDAATHKRWKEAGPGPLGWPSEPKPYGVITADIDLAVSMTQRCLDEEVDQDGDPETPVITAADISEDAA